MKDTTLQTLLTARALLEQAEDQCTAGDRYLSTAGLIVLQDALELIFLAVLFEKEEEEQKNFEHLSFDQMIGELKKIGIHVPKAGTLKAMNKLRVTAKHYGQIMEPSTVQNHLSTSKFAIDTILHSAVGKTLKEIFLTELIFDCDAKPYLFDAVRYLAEGRHFECQVATRKAFYLEFERDYNIYEFDNKRTEEDSNWFLKFYIGGIKASNETKGPDWIAKHVKSPFDYIQIEHERWRIDAIEYGINTQTLNNIASLTPEAVQLHPSQGWHVRLNPNHQANYEDSALALDLTIEVIRLKQKHYSTARRGTAVGDYTLPDTYLNQNIYEKPDVDSKILHKIAENDYISVFGILTGFNPEQEFFEVVFRSTGIDGPRGFVKKLRDEQLPLNPHTLWDWAANRHERADRTQ
jgi:hypothetical protein